MKWFFALFAIFIAGCSGSDENPSVYRLELDSAQCFFDKKIGLLLVNAPPQEWDALQGEVELCGDFCIRLEADGGALRRQGATYSWTNGSEKGLLAWTAFPVAVLDVEDSIPAEERIAGRFTLVQPGGAVQSSLMGIETRGQ